MIQGTGYRRTSASGNRADEIHLDADRKNNILKNCNRVPFEQLAQLVKLGEISTKELNEAGLEDVKLAPLIKIEEDGIWKQLMEKPEFSALQKYIDRYENNKDCQEHVGEAKRMLAILKDQMQEKIWEELDKDNAKNLAEYIHDYPDGLHRSEAENLLYSLVCMISNYSVLEQLANLLPSDSSCKRQLEDRIHEWERHRKEEEEWQVISNSNDLYQLSSYIRMYPNGSYTREAREKVEIQKKRILNDIKEHPENYTMYDIQGLILGGVFTEQDFLNADVLTLKALDWVMGRNSIDLTLPQTDSGEVVSPEKNTDVFLFGIPTCGKTCVLAGLVSCGGDLSFNTVKHGGKYAQALQSCIQEGRAPDGTRTNFLNLIDAMVVDEEENEHRVSLVEMSGETVVFKIATNALNTLTLEDMGEGAAKLLSNNNRKVIFFVIDPSRDGVLDIQSTETGDRVQASQAQVIERIVDLLSSAENREILKNVDTIHFIMAKSDMLKCDESQRRDKATEILNTTYCNAVNKIKRICSRYQYINASCEEGEKVKVYPFSLGKFMVGQNLAYRSTDSKTIIELIKNSTVSIRPESMWDKVKGIFNKEV